VQSIDRKVRPIVAFGSPAIAADRTRVTRVQMASSP
jgi:hypothetical protein